MSDVPFTTTDGGAPVASDEHSLTVGPDGPILLQDQYLIEQMANFNRERIPERQPHAKGSGAFCSVADTPRIRSWCNLTARSCSARSVRVYSCDISALVCPAAFIACPTPAVADIEVIASRRNAWNPNPFQ